MSRENKLVAIIATIICIAIIAVSLAGIGNNQKTGGIANVISSVNPNLAVMILAGAIGAACLVAIITWYLKERQASKHKEKGK